MTTLLRGDHGYKLIFGIVPRLGLRGIGYLVFFIFSVVLFGLCCCCPDIYTKNGGAFSVSTFLVLASLVVMVVANREEDSYVRKLVFTLPCYACAVIMLIDFIGFVLFFLCGIQMQEVKIQGSFPIELSGMPDVKVVGLCLSSSGVLPESLKIAADWASCCGFIVCLILLVVYVIWYANYELRRCHCTWRKDSYDRFAVTFYTRD